MHPLCTQFALGDVRMTLKPNPAFVPKVMGSCSPIDLVAIAAPPEDQRLHTLCPVYAVPIYMDKMRCFRRTDQLFVSWANPHKGKPVTKQSPSHLAVLES